MKRSKTIFHLFAIIISLCWVLKAFGGGTEPNPEFRVPFPHPEVSYKIDIEINPEEAYVSGEGIVSFINSGNRPIQVIAFDFNNNDYSVIHVYQEERKLKIYNPIEKDLCNAPLFYVLNNTVDPGGEIKLSYEFERSLLLDQPQVSFRFASQLFPVLWWDNISLVNNYNVENLMSEFWGPSMNFTFTENKGIKSINGHKAYFVEGILNSGMARTIFIVWQCQQSKRLFIADCNINMPTNTPLAYLKLQTGKMTESVHCHNFKGKSILMDPVNDLFATPDGWTTDSFIYVRDTSVSKPPGNFPKCISYSTGSLWSLMTDSEVMYEFRTIETQAISVSDALDEYFINLTDDTLFKSINKSIYGDYISEIDYNEPSLEKDSVFCTGYFNYNSLNLESGRTSKTRHKFLARADSTDKGFVIRLLSISSIASVWGLEFDLSPSSATFNKYIQILLKDETYIQSYETLIDFHFLILQYQQYRRSKYIKS